MKITRVLVSILASSIFLASCSSDDDITNNNEEAVVDDNTEDPEEPIVESDPYEEGIIISHEGTFSGISGSTSYVSFDLETVDNGIYNTVNNEQLGVFQQSIGFNGDDAYIVVDNQNTITRVNRYTFEKQNEITTSLFTPRFMAFNGTKAYVSNWGDTSVDTDDFIAIIDLETQEVETTISVDLGPEQLAITNDKLYVSHKGAWGTNNIVSVIDLATNEVATTIEVGDNPDELVVVDDELWVAVGGIISYSDDVTATSGNITVINTTTDAISKTYEFSEEAHVSLMDYEDDTVYYTLGSEIYALDIDAEALSTTPIATATSIYGLSINDGKIYTVDAGDFTSNGFLSVYDISANEWSSSIELSIGAAKIYFN